MPPKKPPIRKAKGYQMAQEFSPGTIMIDLFKKSWKIHQKIGQGGFGLLYSASKVNETSNTGANDDFVVKVEPSENGPLFGEINFYIRVAKPEMLEDFKKLRKLSHLAVPRYVSSGLHENSYRFLVMDRYDVDLHHIMRSHRLKSSTLIKIGLQILDALEYLHSKDYAHADVKALNILRNRGQNANIFLVDFGLASRFMMEKSQHRIEKADAKWKHNGTIEYCSTDSHFGLPPSRRADLEILFYNLLDWLSQYSIYKNFGENLPEASGCLPWYENILRSHLQKRQVGDLPIKIKEDVAEMKRSCLAEPIKLVRDTLNLSPTEYKKWDDLVSFIVEVRRLSYSDQPDYHKFQQYLMNLIKTTSDQQQQSHSSSYLMLDWSELSSTTLNKSRKRSSETATTSSDVPTAKRLSIEKDSTVSSSKIINKKNNIRNKKKVVANDDCNEIIPGLNVTPLLSKFRSVNLKQDNQACHSGANNIIPGLHSVTGTSSHASTSKTPGHVHKDIVNRKSANCQTSPELLIEARKKFAQTKKK